MTRTSAPAAYGTAIKSNGRKAPPNIVTHKECVAQIMGTSAFTVNTLAINPGLSSTFPWLSIEANGYNYYRFRSFQIRYVTRDNTMDRGTVCIAWDPNPDHAPPANMLVAENYETKLAISPWMSEPRDTIIVVPAEDLNRLKRFLVRNALVATDFETYDTGEIFICTSGNTNTGLIGELFLDFTLEFHAPIVTNLSLVPNPQSNSYFTQNAALPVPNNNTLVVIPWDTVGLGTTGYSYNPIGITPIAGVFTGMRGSITVYFQATLNPSVPIATAAIGIQTSPDGTNWTNLQLAAFTPVAAGVAITQNIEMVVQLLPSTSFRCTIQMLGTTTTGNSTAFPLGKTNGVLVLTAA